MIIEKEAAQSWHDMQRAIDELNSNGNEIPVYRAALTLPLTQAGITAVVGAIAEFPSGFTLFLLNTGGAGEVFLICAIDGVWRVWTVTPSSGGMPLIDPAVMNNFALQNADGSLYNAGFGAGAVGENLLTAVDVDGAREVLGLAPQFNRPRHLDWQTPTWQSLNIVGSGAGSIPLLMYHQLESGATANSTIRRNINSQVTFINRSATGINWAKKLDIVAQIRVSTTNTEGIFRVIVGKITPDPFGLPATGNYVSVTVENVTITTGHVCKAGVLTSVALTPTNVTNHMSVFIRSNNGTVSWYYNGVLLGQTTEGPVTNSVGTLNLEINNGDTAALYTVRLIGESYGY